MAYACVFGAAPRTLTGDKALDREVVRLDKALKHGIPDLR